MKRQLEMTVVQNVAYLRYNVGRVDETKCLQLCVVLPVEKHKDTHKKQIL